jgi:hypothetical protein
MISAKNLTHNQINFIAELFQIKEKIWKSEDVQQIVEILENILTKYSLIEPPIIDINNLKKLDFKGKGIITNIIKSEIQEIKLNGNPYYTFNDLKIQIIFTIHIIIGSFAVFGIEDFNKVIEKYKNFFPSS